MDEPLASLDDKRKSEVLPFIARLPKEFGVPILYVTHIFPEIQVLADQVALVENGSRALLENPKTFVNKIQQLTDSLANHAETTNSVFDRATTVTFRAGYQYTGRGDSSVVPTKILTSADYTNGFSTRCYK